MNFLYNLQGRKLFFEDGKKRIDFVLSWSTKAEKNQEKDEARKKKISRETYERNLETEGLELEYDIKVMRCNLT